MVIMLVRAMDTFQCVTTVSGYSSTAQLERLAMPPTKMMKHLLVVTSLN